MTHVQKNVKILYFNPIKQIKLYVNRILVNSFNNKNDDYFKMNQNEVIHYYDIKRNEIDKTVVDKIEKKNKKKLKTYIYLKID